MRYNSLKVALAIARTPAPTGEDTTGGVLIAGAVGCVGSGANTRRLTYPLRSLTQLVNFRV